MIEAEVKTAREGNPQITWQLPDPPDLTMRIEPHWGRRLLRHLLKNAIQHGLKDVPRPFIEVCGRVENGKVHVSVTNNGPQVPEHEQNLLFHARLSDEEGRRRGLLVVRFVAEKCGGGARLVRSDASGTCFEFYIPVAEESQHRAA
jgi:signal transduction histidine kinase